MGITVLKQIVRVFISSNSLTTVYREEVEMAQRQQEGF